MKRTSLCAKPMFVLAIIVFAFACSSCDGKDILPEPEIPGVPEPGVPKQGISEPDVPEPDVPKPGVPKQGISEPDVHLQISNGVVIGIDDGITEVVFPANVKRIKTGAFKNKAIRKLTLNEGLETIEAQAFIASSLEEINFPSTLKEIGQYAFYQCLNLSTVDLSRTQITTLPESTFGFSGLQSVVLPSTLTDIGVQAFLNTSKLTSIEVPVSVKNIGDEAFRETGATSILLPNNLSIIKLRAFYLCPNLQQVRTHGVIIQDDPDGVMQESCFEGCPKLTVFEIPLNIRRIGQGALAANAKVKSITIPANINYIAFSAFGNTGIKDVNVESSTPPTVILTRDIIAWCGFPDNVVSITVPAGKAEAYKAADGWKEFANKIKQK